MNAKDSIGGRSVSSTELDSPSLAVKRCTSSNP